MKKILLTILYKILALFARVYLARAKPISIGVTGSVGKTSCRVIVARVLARAFPASRVYTSPKNYNSELGLVFSIFQVEDYSPGIVNLLKKCFELAYKSIFMPKKYDIIVLEYGIDHPHDMEHLLSVHTPEIAIFTQLDHTHAENFADGKNGVGAEKMKLLQASKIAYLNAEDSFQNDYSSQLKNEVQFWGEKKIDFSYTEKNKIIVASFTTKNHEVTTNMLGSENFYYIELGLEIAQKLEKKYGLHSKLEKDFFLQMENQKGRFSIFEGLSNAILIDSSYNAGLRSMKKMIDNAVDIQKLYPERKLLFVLGDMREVGEVSDEIHKELYSYASKFGEIVSVGAETRKNFGVHLGNFKYSRDAGVFLKKYLEHASEKYIVLFKGSQNTIFLEEAIKELLANPEDKKKLVRQEKYWNKTNF